MGLLEFLHVVLVLLDRVEVEFTPKMMFCLSDSIEILEQAIGGEDGYDEQDVTENIDRDGLYDEEDEGGFTTMGPRTPDLSRNDSGKKVSTTKGQGSQKEVDGAETLTVKDNVFDMQFTVKVSTPHIILAEVTCVLLAESPSNFDFDVMFYYLVYDENTRV